MELVKWCTCVARDCKREAAWPWYVCTAHLPDLERQQTAERAGAAEYEVARRAARKLAPPR